MLCFYCRFFRYRTCPVCSAYMSFNRALVLMISSAMIWMSAAMPFAPPDGWCNITCTVRSTRRDNVLPCHAMPCRGLCGVLFVVPLSLHLCSR